MAEIIRQKRDLITEEMPDGFIVVPIDGDNVNRVLSLNGTGGFVWQLLAQGMARDELAARVSEEYNISLGEANADLTDFLDNIREYITIERNDSK